LNEVQTEVMVCQVTRSYHLLICCCCLFIKWNMGVLGCF